MSKQVRVGFVGVGGIATEFHLPALKEIEGVEIAAVCDADLDRAKAAAGSFGGRAYGDHHAMLDETELEALFVCVPPFAHTDVEILAAARGLHLYIEKPVTLEMEKGQEMLAAIERAGVISCVGYQLRYMPAAQAGRDFLAGKQVALVAANRWGGIPGGPGHWWRRMELSGGMFHEMATHNLDFIRYTVGDVVRVSARYGLTVLKQVENLTLPDSQVILLEFGNGAVGYFSASCALTAGGGYTSTDVLLRDMQVKLGFDKITLLPEGRELELPPPGLTIHQAFIHALRTGDRSVIRSDFRDALKTAEVTLGANASARTGQPVEMKLA